MKNLLEFLDRHTAIVKRMFTDNGQVEPMWIIETKHEGCILVATPWTSREEKELTIQAITAIMKSKQATRYIFMSEAWEVTGLDGKIPESVALGASVASHPDRQEILILTAEDHEKQVIRRMRILRPEQGKPHLLDAEADDMDSEGRLIGLLKQ